MSVSFMKRGAAAQQAVQQHKVEGELRRSTFGKMFRFWLKNGEEARVTFVDGELDENGFFNPARAYEHKVFRRQGQPPEYYLCPEKNQPQSGVICPICASGDFPSFNAYLTIIDHRSFASTKTPGKIVTNVRRLFVANVSTMDKQLVMLAQKLGGLAGQTFDIKRGENQKSSRTGDVFFPVEKKPIAVLQQTYMEPVLDQLGKPTGAMQSIFVPADYDKETVQLGVEELLQLGFGKPQGQTEFKSPAGGHAGAAAASNVYHPPAGTTAAAGGEAEEEELF